MADKKKDIEWIKDNNWINIELWGANLKKKDLKCCGNCSYFIINGTRLVCEKGISNYNKPWEVCSRWKFDEISLEGREVLSEKLKKLRV